MILASIMYVKVVGANQAQQVACRPSHKLQRGLGLKPLMSGSCINVPHYRMSSRTIDMLHAFQQPKNVLLPLKAAQKSFSALEH